MTASSPLSAQIAAALDWWREAGVSYAYSDEPQEWLEEIAPERGAQNGSPPPPMMRAKPEPPPPPPRPRLGGDVAQWPATLADFAPWWMGEPTLDATGTTGRVPPRGAAGAALMVVVPMPENGDAQTGLLLSGPQGKLLLAMLRVMGLEADDCYLAAALPRAMPAPDWDLLRSEGMGAVLAHHIALAAPRRLLLLGDRILPLLGHDPSQKPALLSLINQSGAGQSRPEPGTDASGVAVLVGQDLGMLLENPRRKAGFWRSWLHWSNGLDGIRD